MRHHSKGLLQIEELGEWIAALRNGSGQIFYLADVFQITCSLVPVLRHCKDTIVCVKQLYDVFRICVVVPDILALACERSVCLYRFEV